MATHAPRRLARSLPARARSVRVPAFVVIGGLVALSVMLRTKDFGVGLWGDEGLSVGIADRPLGDLPAALRLDGSPPLYYGLLHIWMAVFGRSEEETHALSLLFAVLAIPAAWWAARAVFGPRAGWIGALLVATNPFLTQYAQETRMYSLLMLLGVLACGCFARAFAFTGTDEDPGSTTRRRWAVAFAVALATMLYTHNWTLFFGVGCGTAWLGLLAAAPPGARRELLVDGLIGFGGALLLYVPWLPTFVFQVQHTGAPWSHAPTLEELLDVPERLVGQRGQYVLLLGGGVGVIALLADRRGRVGARGRAAVAILCVALATMLAAWASSQVSPAWAGRYLAIGVPPLLLASAGGLAHAGRLGLIAVLLVAVLWSNDQAPERKSNVRELASMIAPSLRPGDMVVSTQPEEIPLLHYYLPPGLEYATLWGPVRDVGVSDWRDGVEHLRATSAPRDFEPLLDRLPSGRRLVLITPVIEDMERWVAPWTELVRVRSAEWRQYVSNDPRFVALAVRPAFPEERNNQWQATILLKD